MIYYIINVNKNQPPLRLLNVIILKKIISIINKIKIKIYILYIMSFIAYKN